jgi:hypothetical protein
MNENVLIGIIFIGVAILLVIYNLYRQKREYNHSTQGVLIKSWIAVAISLFMGIGLIFDLF